MNSEKNAMLDEMYPLPEGTTLRTRKFGVNPAMPLKSTHAGNQQAPSQPDTPFQLCWEDSTLGLTVVLHEDRATGKLIVEVSCNDPGLTGKAAASVALVGQDESQMIRKTIKLNRPENCKGGCRGSDDFGLLSDAVAKLGPNLGLVVFMVV